MANLSRRSLFLGMASAAFAAGRMVLHRPRMITGVARETFVWDAPVNSYWAKDENRAKMGLEPLPEVYDGDD